MNPRGFGFVATGDQEDVFISPGEVGPALHGDIVEVEVLGRSSRGLDGRIAEIVQRRRPEVAGTLRRRGKSAWLEPDDGRIRGPIVLWAKGLAGKDGDAAVARIESFPNYADENPEGTLVAVLGEPGDPKAEVAKILVREQVEEEHSDDAHAEAQKLSEELARQSHQNRRDLRQIPLPTIDPKDARDHDDALWAEATPEGYRVWIAIADVSEYVRPGSALDAEASLRGCTIYLPDRAIPMLPRELAGDACSLLPDVERLCLAVVTDLDRQGKVTSFEVVEGRMRSAAKLTYDGVARTLGLTLHGPLDAGAEALKPGLAVLYELSQKLRKMRFLRGALGLDLPEAQVILDETSKVPLDVVRRAQDPGVKIAYTIVEEFMLLANELVARFLVERKCPAIYRVHAKPDEEKLERLGLIAEVLGVKFDMEAMRTPFGVSQWLLEVQTHERRTVLEMALLRSLKQAAYDTVNVGHFGLASDSYLHFTSPIRRYPDLLVHRTVKQLLRGKPPNTSDEAIAALKLSAGLSSTRERAAMDIEREVVDLYRALFMRDKVGEVFEGTVTAVVGSGVYVTLKAVFVDVLMRYESIGPDHYELDEHELSVVGARSGDRVALGDTLHVVIEDVALMRRAVFARRVLPEGLLEKMQQDFPQSPDSGGGRRSGPNRDARGGRTTSDAKRGDARNQKRGGRRDERGRQRPDGSARAAPSGRSVTPSESPRGRDASKPAKPGISPRTDATLRGPKPKTSGGRPGSGRGGAPGKQGSPTRKHKPK